MPSGVNDTHVRGTLRSMEHTRPLIRVRFVRSKTSRYDLVAPSQSLSHQGRWCWLRSTVHVSSSMDPLSRLVAVETVKKYECCRTVPELLRSYGKLLRDYAIKLDPIFPYRGGDASNRSAENRLEVPNAPPSDRNPQPAMVTSPQLKLSTVPWEALWNALHAKGSGELVECGFSERPGTPRIVRTTPSCTMHFSLPAPRLLRSEDSNQ